MNQKDNAIPLDKEEGNLKLLLLRTPLKKKGSATVDPISNLTVANKVELYCGSPSVWH